MKFLSHTLNPLFTLLRAELAETSGVELYAVGGAVRDEYRGAAHEVQEIDIAVDGGGRHDAAGEFARGIKERCPDVAVVTYPQFQTAKITLGADTIDLSTTRCEVYSQPAGAPRVVAATIVEDLVRRDFSINAIAVKINPSEGIECFDPFGGVADVNSSLLRVLHKDSFRDDPSRIVRGIKFAIRFDYAFEAETAAWLREAVATNAITVLDAKSKHISLRKRFGRELVAIFSHEHWSKGLALLLDFEVTHLIHPAFAGSSMDEAVREAVANAQKNDGTPIGVSRLGALLALLPPSDCVRVAKNLGI